MSRLLRLFRRRRPKHRAPYCPFRVNHTIHYCPGCHQRAYTY